MRTRPGLAAIGFVVGCLWLGACTSYPTETRSEADHNYYSVGALGDGDVYVAQSGEREGTTQSDSTTQRGGVGGFGSGN